jgi:hypothetical protein
MRMENELLALENRFLKARLGASEARIGRLEATAKQTSGASSGLQETVSVPLPQYRRLEAADRDVRFLIGKLNRRPYRWFLRSRIGFKRFVTRYDQPSKNGDGS